jgi:hypothetical protein
MSEAMGSPLPASLMMRELLPALQIDARRISDDGTLPVTRRLQAAFATLVAAEREPLP